MTEPHPNSNIRGTDPASYIQSLLVIIEKQNRIIEEQSRIIAELREKNAHLKARIAELEARLNQNSRNSNRPPSTDVFSEDPTSQRNKGERPPGGQKGHTGKTLEWVEIPDRIEVHHVTIYEECGASLEDLEPVKTEQRQVHDKTSDEDSCHGTSGRE